MDSNASCRHATRRGSVDLATNDDAGGGATNPSIPHATRIHAAAAGDARSSSHSVGHASSSDSGDGSVDHTAGSRRSNSGSGTAALGRYVG